MRCPRCAAEHAGSASQWCADCEALYDAWVRQHAADIIWQTFAGAGIAMVIGLGLPVLGLPTLLGTVGVLIGFGAFRGLRAWNTRRRRRQFLAGSLPRAYLPDRS